MDCLLQQETNTCLTLEPQFFNSSPRIAPSTYRAFAIFCSLTTNSLIVTTRNSEEFTGCS